MAKFATKLTKATVFSTRAIGVVYSATTNPRRIKLYDFGFGCNTGTPVDAPYIYQVCRQTAIGSLAGTNPTIKPLDPADATLTSLVTDGVTGDGTYDAITAALYNQAVNSRASMRWACVPGAEMISPATASNGFMLGVTPANTIGYDAYVMCDEL